jgi:S1-C subfamily serine protease
VKVTEIEQGSPAQGILRRGDVILSINGHEVKDEVSFFDLVRSSSIKMQFTFRRGGNTNTGEATLRW